MGFSEKQRAVLAFPFTGKTALICDGAVRTGKTSVMSLSFIRWAMDCFDRQSFAICGKTVASAERNIITPLLGVGYLKEHFTLSFSRSRHLLTVQRGSRTNYFYIFGGRDESSFSLIQGITLAGVFLDEVALMPRSFVEQAMARCSVEGSKFWFSCNPEGPTHWFYQEWILKAGEKDAMHLHFVMQDNPGLSETIRKRYESLYTGVFYRRYILGEWCVAEGLVYDFGEENITDEIPEIGEYYISVDYGTLNPFSAGLWSWDGKQAVRIREYYHNGRAGRQLTDEEYYEALEELAGDLPIRSVIVDPSAASFITTIRKHGRFRVRQANNEVLDGIRVTAAFLKSGTVKIHRSCKASITEFGLYRWDTDANADKPIKENDHAMDEIRYFCYTILRMKAGKNEGYKPLWM